MIQSPQFAALIKLDQKIAKAKGDGFYAVLKQAVTSDERLNNLPQDLLEIDFNQPLAEAPPAPAGKLTLSQKVKNFLQSLTKNEDATPPLKDTTMVTFRYDNGKFNKPLENSIPFPLQEKTRWIPVNEMKEAVQQVIQSEKLRRANINNPIINDLVGS